VLSIGTTPWAREALTDKARATIETIVPAEIGRLTLGAGRSRGDWNARLYRDRTRNAPPVGVSYHGPTLIEAVGAAVVDYRLGPALAWCSLCSEPAVFQIAGEAYCPIHEANRMEVSA
jgi:hypothetical protein